MVLNTVFEKGKSMLKTFYAIIDGKKVSSYFDTKRQAEKELKKKSQFNWSINAEIVQTIYNNSYDIRKELNTMKNNTIKELLSIDPKAMKSLNQVFHFDYNKEFKAVTIPGNTTINQIQKKIQADSNDLIVVINFNCGYWYDRLQVGMIDYLGNSVTVDYSPHYFSGDNIMSAYHSIGDFRDDLKSKQEKAIHFIIAQNKDYLSIPGKKTIDLNNRFKIATTNEGEKAIDLNRHSYSSDSYISKVTIIDHMTGGIKYSYSPSGYFRGKDFKNIDEIIDKSGYIVSYFREELSRKARILKSEREKQAYLAVDNSAKVEELDLRIKAKKLEIIEQLKLANDSESLKAIAKSLEYWRNGFTSIVSAYEEMTKKIANKSYPSIDDFNRNYDQINKMLLNCGKD